MYIYIHTYVYLYIYNIHMYINVPLCRLDTRMREQACHHTIRLLMHIKFRKLKHAYMSELLSSKAMRLPCEETTAFDELPKAQCPLDFFLWQPHCKHAAAALQKILSIIRSSLQTVRSVRRHGMNLGLYLAPQN